MLVAIFKWIYLLLLWDYAYIYFPPISICLKKTAFFLSALSFHLAALSPLFAHHHRGHLSYFALKLKCPHFLSRWKAFTQLGQNKYIIYTYVLESGESKWVFVWVASHPISLSFCQTIGYRQARRINWKFKHIDQHKYVDKVQVQSAAWLLLAKLLFVNVRGGIWPTGCYFVHIYGSFGYLGITGLNVCSSLLKYRFYVARRRFLLTDGCYLTECNELWKDFVEKVLK